MAVKITIPVEFQDSAQSYKQILAQLQEQLKRIKPGTALYDGIKQQIAEAEKEIKKVDAKLDLGIISKSEMQSITSYLTRVDALIKRASDSLKTVNIGDLIDFSDQELFDGDQLKQIQLYRDEIELLQEQIKKLSGSKVKDVLKSSDKAKFTGIELDSDVVKTYQSLSEELQQVEEQVVSTDTEFKSLLASTLKAKSEIIAFKKNNAQDLDQKKVSEVRTAQDVLGTSGDSLKNVRTRLLAELDKIESTWGTGGKDFSARILEYLGLDPTQIASIVSDSFEETRKAVNAAFASNGSGKMVTKDSLEDARNSISSNAALAKIAELERMEADFQRDKARVLELGQLRKILPQLKEKVELLFAEVSVTDDDGTEVDVFKKYQEVIQLLQKAIAEARKSKLTTGADSDQQDTALEANIAGVASSEAAFVAKQDAEKFKDNLKQAISHWLSAQMIITKVREGIHQAWTDIQGLDKAMTNIAVVTDMSVSDLWGKIDEYMAIAQEYGVTTQGVYEVSQLYYQQGLSTNEVMEATTETLKMARIAGMDYAEAADAMTVAIRAFKMEMSDAQIITDVYSKVAAVTASDSEELAIAMSKTASSAESVGSSFENTTAMLAVMIETTRESAQNLGSALKSIISRYGEMKTGLTVDSEGEAIDYNKVDTALQSVGISIKDAQGQFRDFDDVIFELSKKWDSLDKNTQRYIATIMAGNRQQSRFIALVDNWERLDEVSKAAYDSEDAGLLQYAKTLDSLETKLNALSTSFQQFYMNIVNGGFFKGIVDIITSMLNGFNKLGSWTSIFNIASLIATLKTVSSTLSNGLSTPLSQFVANCRKNFEEVTRTAFESGRQARQNFQQGWNSADVPLTVNTTPTNSVSNTTPKRRRLTNQQVAASQQSNGFLDTAGSWLKKNQGKVVLGASILGSALTTSGAAVANDNKQLGSIMSLAGSTISNGATGFVLGGVPGLVIGAATGIITNISSVLEAWTPESIIQEKLDKANDAFKEAELTRATKKEEARNLAATLENLKKLQAARYESEEAEAAYIEASNNAHEIFPELVASFDEAGNAIIDVTSETSNAEDLLRKARKASADAALEAAAAELSINSIKRKQAQDKVDSYSDAEVTGNIASDLMHRFNGSNYGTNTWSEMHAFLQEASQNESLTAEDFAKSYKEKVTQVRGEEYDYHYSQAQAFGYTPEEAAQYASEMIQSLIDTDLETLNTWLDHYDLIDLDLGETYESLLINLNNANGELKGAISREVASQEATVLQTINQLKQTKEPIYDAEMWSDIDNFYSLFTEELLSSFEYDESDFVNGKLESGAQSRLNESFNTLYEQFEGLHEYLKNNFSFEDFNKVIASGEKGLYTYEDYQKELLKITDGQFTEVVGYYLNAYEEQIQESSQNLSKYLSAGTIDWSQFYEDVDDLQLVLSKIPIHYHNDIAQFAKQINTKVDEGVLSNSQGMELVTNYLDLWFNLPSLVDPSQLTKIQTLISSAAADGSLFTIGGQTDLQRALKEAGVTNINIADIIPIYTVNLTTEFALLYEKVATGLKSLHSSLEKIGDGLDFEDATKLANKMGKDLIDVFTFEDGKWQLKDQNLDEVISTIEKEYSDYQIALEEQLKNDVRILNSSMSNLLSKEDIDRYLELMSEENVSLAKDWASARGLKYNSDHDLVEAYLNSQYNNIAEVYKAEKEWLIDQAVSSLNIGKISRELSGGQAEQNKRKALDIIKANGYTGYSSDDAATIIEYLGLDQASINEIFRSLGDGTFAINTSYLKDKLSDDVIAALNDALSENVNRYFELAEKSIKSGLTDSEKLEFGQLQLPPNLANDYIAIFLDQGKTDIEKYITLIKGVITNNKGSWDDIEEQIESYYTSIFDSIFTIESGLDQDSRNALKNIRESEGFFSPDNLAEVFTQFSRELGSSLFELDLTTLFDYDKVSQSLILATSEEANAILKKLPLDLQKALKGAENQRNINRATRLEETSEAVLEQVTSILTDVTNVTLQSLINTYEAINGEGTFANSNLLEDYQLAIAEAKAGNVDILREHLYKLVAMARAKGVDVSGLEIIIQDATFAIVQAIADNIRAAAEGSLSAAGLDSLSKELNINLSAYTQKTFDGYKVSTQGMIKLGTAMVQKYGATYDVAKEMFDLFVGDSGIYKGYRDIVKAAEDLNDPTKKQTKELQAQKKLLTDMAKIAMFNPDDPLFNFMDQDPSKGLALTASSMVDSIDKVKEAFATLKEGENISATDFYNMMDFMYDKLGGWDNLVNALGISDAALAKLGINAKAGEDVYGRFVNAIVSQSKILGEVDADVLMGIGLSVENMAGGMSDSLKQVANDQIEQLKAMRQTLVAMKELEGLGDIEFGFGLTAKDGTALDVFNFDQYLDEFEPEIITEKVQSKIDEVNAIFQNKGINIDWSLIFGEDGFTINDPTELAAFKNIMQFASSFADETSQEVWTAMAQKFSQAGEEFSWQSLIEAIASAEDWGSFAAGLSAEVQTLINAEIGQIPGIEIDSFEGTTIKLAEGANASSFIEQIKSVYGRYGYDEDVLKIDAEGSEIKVAIVNAQVNAQIDASTASLRQDGLGLDWSYLMDSDTYQATATIDNLETVITVNRLGEVTYKTVSGKELNQNNVKEFLNNNGLNIDTLIEEGATANTATFNLTMSGAEEAGTTVTTINEDVKAIRKALENPIKIEVDDQATVKLGEIEAAYIQLADTLAARPLVISTEGTSLSGAITSKEGESNEQQELPTLEQKISVTWEGLDDWKQEDLSQSIKRNFTNKDGWKQSGLTQTVTVNYQTGSVPSVPIGGGTTGSGAQSSDPTVGAKGNVNLLKVGAAFARGTLMGELGPELYVQNGQYHIAGANGPEFVDLDPDAIVFNHLQTAGLLGKGHITSTGSPVISERRSVALATGNITGPAMASGLDSAIEAIDRAIAIWQNILGSTTQDLLNNSGGHKGGGSGNSIKAVTEELQEWYNLSRQIEDIQQNIKNLIAESANIEWSNGEAYLRNLREQQKLLQQQMATQQALLDYQELQLQRQADHINQNRIWSQFLTIGEDGLLQYIEGNETNGGKGALQVLQELNQMSGEEQSAYLARLGYSYTNNDGEKLEGQELVEQFFQELQDQIDQYDSLYDTVHGTQETLEELQTSINDINDQIKENQMELEEEIFDIIVEALEKEIEVLEEQADLIEEANEAYINGLNEALSAERQMYDDNQKIADREQLQRQLSLLRRSGGSASEIANLEEQLNDMLKDEYFTNQERMIEEIQKANDLQVQQLQTQIKLQEDSLQYQKEHGVIWTQVYQVLAQSKDEILAFMQGQKPEFFSQSLLQQEAMLTEWAHKIGIYSEDRKYQNFAEHARNNLWDNGQAWNLGYMSKYQSTYNTLTDEEKNTIRDQFTSVYAQARLDGKDHTTAANEAAAAVSQTLKRKQDAGNAEGNTPPTTNPNPTNPGGGSSGGDSGESGGGSSGDTSESSPTHYQFYYNGKRYRCFTTKEKAIEKIQALNKSFVADNPNNLNSTDLMAEARKRYDKAVASIAKGTHAQGYSEGGLVDYTGVAIVHGSKTKPESFLNAEQTAQIREGLKESGKGGALEGIKAALLKLDSYIKAVTNISNKTESNSYTIAPGAVVIQVEQLNDAYDIDTLSADIMNRMYAIGNKSTNRGVSRR